MILRGSATLRSKKSATVIILPPSDVVPVGLRVTLPRPAAPRGYAAMVHVLDVKVGKNSQGAGITHFMSDMLSDMVLRLDRTHGALNLAVYLFNDGDDVDVEVELDAVPAESASELMAVPIGFFDFPGRHPMFNCQLTQDPISPGEVRTLAAWTQVSGFIRRVLFSRNVLCDIKIRTSSQKGKPIKPIEHEVAQSSGFRGVGTYARVDLTDKLVIEITNRGTLPISACDFAAVVEGVEPYSEAAAGSASIFG